MKFLGLFFTVSLILWASTAHAQSIYNKPNNDYQTGGPLSLNQLMRGNENAATGARNVRYYGGQNFRPYGLDNDNFSLNLTPEQVRANRAERDRLAQQREQENLENLNNYYDELAAYEAQIQQQNQQGQASQSRSRGPVRRVLRDDSEERRESVMPRRIFNSLN